MPLRHCEWVEGGLRIVGPEETVNPEPHRPNEVEVARLRLRSPRVINPWGWAEDHHIRTWTTQSEQIVTFMQSLEDGFPRIILTPTMTIDEHGRVVVNLDIGCETADVVGGPDFGTFWKTVVRRTAPALAEKLSVGIQRQLCGYGLYPEADDEGRPVQG